MGYEGLCLSAPVDGEYGGQIDLRICDRYSKAQRWTYHPAQTSADAVANTKAKLEKCEKETDPFVYMNCLQARTSQAANRFDRGYLMNSFGQCLTRDEDSNELRAWNCQEDDNLQWKHGCSFDSWSSLWDLCYSVVMTGRNYNQACIKAPFPTQDDGPLELSTCAPSD